MLLSRGLEYGLKSIVVTINRNVTMNPETKAEYSS
jgi:hypothetical protein